MAFYARVRADEGWRRSETLPRVPRGHRQERIWKLRARHFDDFLAWLHSARGPAQRVADVGAGCCWAAERLAERGHAVAALDVNLCSLDGLLAIGLSTCAARGIERIEADMEFLPLDAAVADVVLLNGTLHYTRCPQNVLAEARRVLAPGGALVILDSPVYRLSRDGEAMVRAQRRRFLARYGYAPERESAVGFFTLSDLRRQLARAGFEVELHGWPGRVREVARDIIEIAKAGRRTARFPMIVGKKKPLRAAA